MSQIRTISDPHHDGYNVWMVKDGKLYHKEGAATGKWTEVKRVSFTPERILAIASLLTKPETETNSIPLADGNDWDDFR